MISGSVLERNLRPLGQRQADLVASAREAVEQQGEERLKAADLTEEEQKEFEIVWRTEQMYADAKKAREPFETFDIAWDLFIGNVWPTRWPTWRARITVNKVRAFITFMQAIMTDNKPRFSVEPTYWGSEDAADLLHQLADRHWDDDDVQDKMSLVCLYGLIWGTGFIKRWFDPYADGGRGKHMSVAVPPYRIFANQTATCVEDAEYLIHVEDQTMGWVRRNFPDKAKLVAGVKGVRTGDYKERDRDFVREGDQNEQLRIISAQNMGNGNITPPLYASPNQHAMQNDSDLVEIQECWFRDERREEYQRPKYENGKPVMQPKAKPDGTYEMEKSGTRTAISPIDGQPFQATVWKPKMVPVMVSDWRYVYPNGRLVIKAGGKVLLRDIPNPFQIDGFPFAMWKDYDTGTFNGTGEPIALKDCQLATNRIISQVYDILEKIGNPTFKIKKGGGVNKEQIKNKPGLLIPMDDMDSIAPLEKPPIPKEFFELFQLVAKSMAEIAGVNDAVMGAVQASGAAFATVDQLAESAAAPLRLKVRNFERCLSRYGKLSIQLIQQFDNGRRPLRVKASPNKSVVQPPGEVNVEWRSYTKAQLQGQVDFKVIPISSLSTSPAGTWNRYMMLYDKHLIDEIWWHSKFRIEGWRSELPRMLAARKAEAAQEAALKAASKSKPGPSARSNSGRQAARNRQAPPSNIPPRSANAAVR